MNSPRRTVRPTLRPPVAAPLRAGLRTIEEALPTEVRTAQDMRVYRRIAAARGTTADAVAAAWTLEHHDASPELTVFRTPGPVRLRVLFVHGGGLIAGDRFDGVDTIARHARALRLEVWTTEYPLTPERRYDTMVAHLVAVARAASGDGIPVLIAGQSAGGGLAAAVALACRDLGIPVAGQLLLCPMLDARDTESSRQFADDPSWSRASNRACWAAALAGSAVVPPGTRDDLAGLGPTYLDVGSAELFRDSVVGFADALWASGVRTELHVWSGAFHGSDGVVDDAVVSQEAHRARERWLRRLIDGAL